ncbi:hypothetical protein Tco_0536847 [Tanacetum coccineum]
MRRNRQRVPVEYFINNDLNYLQGGVSAMTYMTSTTKTKVAQDDLPGIEDMVPNIWSPVKVAYDKHVLWGISHWREQHKTFYAYARGLQSRHDVYSTKRIMAVTHVKVIRKHGYGYLEYVVGEAKTTSYERLRGRPTAATKNHMILSYDVLIIQKDLILQAGNPIKEILVKLNLPDHRSILTDSKETYKDDLGGTWFQLTHRFIAACSYSTDV